MAERTGPLLSILLSLLFPLGASAQEACIALLQHGLYDTYVQRGFNQQSSVLFSQVCDAYTEQKKSGGFLGLNLGDVGISLGGESLKEIGRMMCDIGYTTEDAVEHQNSFKQVLNTTALDVFNNCVQNTRDGLQVQTTRPDDDTLVISVRYVSPNPARLKENGLILTNSAFSCSGSLWDLARRGGKLKSGSSYQVTCHRISLFDPPKVLAGRHIYHEGGTFTVDTNAGAIVRYLGPKPALPEMFQARLETLERIAESHGTELAEHDARLTNPRPSESFSCRWTDWLNAFDGNLNSQCAADEFLHGLYSDHNNRHEDRVFKFHCCKLRLRPEG